ncbi:MAG: hypothetical protein JKY51_04190 [Opitutaceae bacterium]|nr:hypothetical protein [Opitutaceae bacterium]
MNFNTSLSLGPKSNNSSSERERLIEFINIKLASRGYPIYGDEKDYPYLSLNHSLIAGYQEKNRLLNNYLCPTDQRIHDFLTDYLSEVIEPEETLLPRNSLILERHGLARLLSIPPDKDSFTSDIISSYRTKQGVLHNPANDRRTTKGVFHIVEGGFTVPADKKEVPKGTFAKLLRHAINPPKELLRLPFTSTQEKEAHLFASLLLRPTVCPEVPGFLEEKSLEIRFFAPGNLVSNLDFVESIFGNAGDPYLPDHNAALDIDHWSGQTGCVILAPHLVHLTKKELGLPHIDDANARQKKEGMCWENEKEIYNDGSAFKITCRDKRGVIVTIIADNYFGYCKKEVKTQISYACNLYGLSEEEHSGGALAFPAYDLGENFSLSHYFPQVNHTFANVSESYAELMHLQPQGFGIDKTFANIIYLPEGAQINLKDQIIHWQTEDKPQSLKLLPEKTYVLPSGYKVEMVKPSEGRRWRLIGTTAEGTFCHKPCTVSGGGKSEISKSISDAMIHGPIFIGNLKEDFDFVEEIIARDYRTRFKDSTPDQPESRPLLHTNRSLGSVVKLLTPSPDYSDEYNDWLRSIPGPIRDLVFLVKRRFSPNWGNKWRQRFTVDVIDGIAGNELKYRNQKIITHYLRVGFAEDGSWRTFSLRKDFFPATKIQREDDISASIVVPEKVLKGLNPDLKHPSWKFVTNCEYRLFQRPDDAIIKGYDIQTEKDFARSDNFFSNYEPLTRETAKEIVEDVIHFDQFTAPMQKVIRDFAQAKERPEYVVSSAQPRLVNGSPSKNPRYLQVRPDLEAERNNYLAQLGTRLYRRIPLGQKVPFPVNSVLPGRRNNPPDPELGIRSLAVYNPIHYQELPELFMDFIASLTGKSPSTTGAGSEGALTKGPFNALPPIIDLNNALVSYLITDTPVFSTAAGYVGPKYKVAHDISLLIPEIWSRMFHHEKTPAYLIENGHFEKCEDFEYKGKTVLASRLGYRITDRFVRAFFGRVFSNPATVFTKDMLQPEQQDMPAFVDGIDNIVSTQKQVAQLYFEDKTIEMACPPLKALLHIMAYGDFEGKDLQHPDIRVLFSREALVKNEWYQERLNTKQEFESNLAQQKIQDLRQFLQKPVYQEEANRMNLREKLKKAEKHLPYLQSKEYLESLYGTIGKDPATKA